MASLLAERRIRRVERGAGRFGVRSLPVVLCDTWRQWLTFDSAASGLPIWPQALGLRSVSFTCTLCADTAWGCYPSRSMGRKLWR